MRNSKKSETLSDLPRYLLLRQRERRVKILKDNREKVEQAFQEFQEERRNADQ